MNQRSRQRLLARLIGAVALLLAGAASGGSGDASRAGSARVALPANGDPTVYRETTDPSPTKQPKPSRVARTRPASTETAPPDPHNGQTPLVESSASEATSFECALDGAAFAECSSPAPHAGALNTFGMGPTADPTLAIDDVTVSEGDAGTVTAGFSVTLSAASESTVTVNYETAGVSATSGVDFQSTAGTLTFDPGVTSQPVNVTVNGDVVDENAETFTVTLSAPTGATLLDDVGTGTITDDDSVPAISIDDNTVAEGANATFTVTLNHPSASTVTVDFASTDGSATSPADYASVGAQLSFAPGEDSKTITVATAGDLLDEDDETYTIALSNATEATIADGFGFGTITDDEALPALSVTDVTVAESGTATFTVTLAPVSGRLVTVNYATANDTASAGSDYTAASGTLTFAAGETTKQVAVAVTGDSLDEPDESFFVNLANATNATLGDTQGVGTITDDDATPSLSIDDKTVAEGAPANLTVTLSAASSLPVSVDYASANGTAIAPGDYGAVEGQLDFAPGETSKTIPVLTTGDVLDEDAETYTIALSNATNATIADGTGIGTISDDDPLPALTVNDVTVIEGTAGTTNATFTVTLSALSGRTVTVGYATANGTATTPADYTGTSGTLTFAAGETTKTVTVPVIGDGLDEGNETYFLNLSNPGNATIADNQGIGTILNDDGKPSLAILDAAVVEGDSGTTSATFTVSLSAASGQTVSVGYSTGDGTATAPADYASTGGNVVFMPGETTKTVTVQVKGDNIDELDESFVVDLAGAVNADIIDGHGVGTITDDDAPPTLSVNDVSVAEGASGTANAAFTVTLSSPSALGITVVYATADGTATAAADYEAASGTLTFDPGTTTRTFTVQVKGDTLDEIDETYTVSLSSPTQAAVADALGLGTILDDDTPSSLAVNDATVIEGNIGSVNATFTVTLNAPSGKAISVDYGTADGTATTPADYTATTGTLTFAAGQTAKTVAVSVNGDSLDEVDETFTLTLASASNATIGDGSGLGTITDNDASPSIAIGDITVAEGDGGASNASFTVSLSAVSGRTVTVNYATANGTATTPADYANTSGSLSFAPGETAKAITVPVNGDVLDEENETFVVNLSGAVGASLSDSQGLGTVTDDDLLPALAVNDATVVESDTGTVAANFAVTLDAPSGRTVTVGFATANGTALAPGDYQARTGSVTFTAGQVTKQVTVLVNGDTIDEVGETYALNLSAGPTNATIADGEGVGTIVDNDGGPSIFINDVTVVEGNSGSVNANFSVSLSASSGQPVSVGYATADDTAAAGSDYTAVGGNLSFAPGQTTRMLTVPVKSDALDEIDESFVVKLSEPVNADIADAEGAGKITDDDPLPLLSVGDVTLAEGDAGTSPATFTVTLNPVSGRTVTVGYATANGSAIAPEDYESVAGTMTFEPGQTTKTVGVPVKGDSVIEADETFVVNLSNVVAGSITDGQAVGTIANDDAAPPPPPPAEPPPPPPPAQDTTPPGEVRNVRVKAGDETATISWANPSDADFQGVSVRRVSLGKSIQNLAVYEGVGTTITQRGLKNGSLYRYRIKTRDRAGNTSTGIVVTAVPKSALLGPAEGAIVTAPPLLRWAPFPRASYYNAQLYLIRSGGQAKALRATKVLSVWPNETRYKLRKTWRYGGKRYRLVPGRYRWYVWPGLGKVSANRYGPMLGESTFTVKAKRKR
ncbi:MAG: beta strand repeat-containing protein [Gaiellaceae bacterium]